MLQEPLNKCWTCGLTKPDSEVRECKTPRPNPGEIMRKDVIDLTGPGVHIVHVGIDD